MELDARGVAGHVVQNSNNTRADFNAPAIKNRIRVRRLMQKLQEFLCADDNLYFNIARDWIREMCAGDRGAVGAVHYGDIKHPREQHKSTSP